MIHALILILGRGKTAFEATTAASDGVHLSSRTWSEALSLSRYWWERRCGSTFDLRASSEMVRQQSIISLKQRTLSVGSSLPFDTGT